MTEPGLRNSFYRKVTRSDRRMTPLRRGLYRLAIPLGLAVIRAWWRLCRVVRIEGEEHLRAAPPRRPRCCRATGTSTSCSAASTCSSRVRTA